MSEEPPNEKPKRSAYQYIGCIATVILGVHLFHTGFHEISTKDGIALRKGHPAEHVTGDAAVREGYFKLAKGALFLGTGIFVFFGLPNSEK